MAVAAHRTRVLVGVTAVSLSARISACKRDEPPALCFSGLVRSDGPDFLCSAAHVGERLAGQPVQVRCLPMDGDGGGAGEIGWCQVCPMAGDLGVAIDVHCCSKRLGILRSTVQFGYAHPRAGLTLAVELLETPASGQAKGSPVTRLPVLGLSLEVALSFAAPAQVTQVARGEAPDFDVAVL